MLDFGSAEVRLKLNTDDYDKSLKSIQSDDRCLEVCLDLDVDSLNKKLAKAANGLDCLDLCVDIDQGKFQKSLQAIQRDFDLSLQAELQLSTRQATEKLRTLEQTTGQITSVLQLQTVDAQRQLSAFQEQLKDGSGLITSVLDLETSSARKSLDGFKGDLERSTGIISSSLQLQTDDAQNTLDKFKAELDSISSSVRLQAELELATDRANAALLDFQGNGRSIQVDLDLQVADAQRQLSEFVARARSIAAGIESTLRLDTSGAERDLSGFRASVASQLDSLSASLTLDADLQVSTEEIDRVFREIESSARQIDSELNVDTESALSQLSQFRSQADQEISQIVSTLTIQAEAAQLDLSEFEDELKNRVDQLSTKIDIAAELNLSTEDAERILTQLQNTLIRISAVLELRTGEARVELSKIQSQLENELAQVTSTLRLDTGVARQDLNAFKSDLESQLGQISSTVRADLELSTEEAYRELREFSSDIRDFSSTLHLQTDDAQQQLSAFQDFSNSSGPISSTLELEIGSAQDTLSQLRGQIEGAEFLFTSQLDLEADDAFRVLNSFKSELEGISSSVVLRAELELLTATAEQTLEEIRRRSFELQAILEVQTADAQRQLLGFASQAQDIVSRIQSTLSLDTSVARRDLVEFESLVASQLEDLSASLTLDADLQVSTEAIDQAFRDIQSSVRQLDSELNLETGSALDELLTFKTRADDEIGQIVSDLQVQVEIAQLDLADLESELNSKIDQLRAKLEVDADIKLSTADAQQALDEFQGKLVQILATLQLQTTDAQAEIDRFQSLIDLELSEITSTIRVQAGVSQAELAAFKSSIEEQIGDIFPTIQSTLDLITSDADRELEEFRNSLGDISSTLRLQTDSAQAELDSFKADLESARAITQELNSTFVAQVEQVINTSSLEQSLRDVVDGIKDSGDDIGDSVADKVGKTKVKTQDKGILGTIRTGFLEKIGSSINVQVDSELKRTFGNGFGDLALITKAIKAIKTPVDLIISDSQLSELVDKSAEAVSTPIRRALSSVGDGLIESAREQEAPLRVFFESLGSSFTLRRAIDDFSVLKKDAEELSRLFQQFVISGEATQSLRGSVLQASENRRQAQITNVATPQAQARAQEILDNRQKKDIVKRVKEGTEELVLVISGFAGAEGKGALKTFRDVRSAFPGENRQVFPIENPNSDPIDNTKEASRSDALIKGIVAGVTPRIIKGFNEDAVELSAQAIAALTEDPQLTIKIVGESFGGAVAADAQEILNRAGFADRTSTIAVGTPLAKASSKPDNFQAVLSTDDPAGDIVKRESIDNILDFIRSLADLDVAKAPDIGGEVLGVEGHLFDFYKGIAEVINFMEGVPEALPVPEIDRIEQGAKDLQEAAKSAETLPLETRGFVADEVKDSIQQLRRQFSVLTGEELERVKKISDDLTETLIDLTQPFDSQQQKQLLGRSSKKVIKAKESKLSDLSNLSASGPTGALNASLKARDEIARNDKLIKAIEEETRNFAGSKKRQLDKTKSQLQEINKSLASLIGQTSGVLTETAQQIAQSTPSQSSIKEKPSTQSTPKKQVEPAADQLSKARKEAGQELQILTAQIRNAREQNVSSLAFETVNSLKNLNAQIFRTEQALLELRAPSFDVPELPQFNETIQGASALIVEIRTEFNSLLSGVADLNQRIRNQKLPDLVGVSEAPLSSAGSEDAFNKVISSVFELGSQIDAGASGLGAEFLDLRDTFVKLGSSIGSGDFTGNLDKANASLSQFIKNADTADPGLQGPLSKVGDELERFQNGLRSASPEQSPESGIASSIRSISEEANKVATELNQVSQKVNAFEPPDLKSFIEAPFQSIREEVSRTAQIFGLANAETGSFGSSLSAAREGLQSLVRSAQDLIKFDNSSIEDSSRQLGQEFVALREQAFEAQVQLSRLKFDRDLDGVEDFTKRLSGSLDDIAASVERTARNVIALENLEGQLTDLIFSIVQSSKVNAAILERVAPSLVAVGEQITAFDANVGRNLQGFGEELPQVLGALGGFTELAQITARSVDVLQEKINSLDIDGSKIEAKFSTLAETLIDKLSEKLGSEVIQPPGNKVAEPVLETVSPQGDPQVPGSGGSVPSVKPAKDNRFLDKIESDLDEFRNEIARQKLEEIEKKKREGISKEGEAQLDRKLEEIRRAGTEAYLSALNPSIVSRLLVDDSFSELSQPLRDELSKQNPKLSKDIESKFNSGNKKKKNQANASSLKVFQTALADPDLEGLAADAVQNFLSAQGSALQKVLTGESTSFADLKDFLGNQFNPSVAKELEKVIQGQGRIDIDAFISKQSVDPLVEEYKSAFKEIRQTNDELARGEDVFNSNSSAIQEQIFRLQELIKLSAQANDVISRVGENPLIQGRDRNSLTGSASFINSQAELAKTQFIPAFQISQGQLPDANVLEDFLKRIEGKPFQDARDLGDETINGLIEGIRQGLPKVGDSGDEAALALLQSIKSALGIASPAKRVIELMRFVIQGVVVGLAGGKDEVQKSFDNLIEIDEVRKSLSRASREIEQTLSQSFSGVSGSDDALDEVVSRINKIQTELSSTQFGGDGLQSIRSELIALASDAERSLGGLPLEVAEKVGMATKQITEFLGDARQVANVRNTAQPSQFNNEQVRVERPPTGSGVQSSFKEFSRGIDLGIPDQTSNTARSIKQQLSSPEVLGAAEKAGRTVGNAAGMAVKAGLGAVKISKEAAEVVAPAAQSGLGGFFSGINNQIQGLQQKFPILQNFKAILVDITFGVGALIGASSLGDLLFNQFTESLQAAKLLESQLKSISISVGGTVAAFKELETIEIFSSNISSNLLTARDSFKQLAAVTRGTALEGDQTREIFEGLATATTALQLPTEQVDRAFTAVGQVISKNRFQAEELRGQLAESLPGSIGILARSIGVSVTELDKLVTSGKLGADVLVNFAQQLRLEFGSGVESAANSLQGAENRLQNSITLIQEQFGQTALPIATAALNTFSSALGFVGENAGTIGGLLAGTLLISLFNLNSRFQLANKAASFFSRTIGLDLKIRLTTLRAELATTGGGLQGFAQKASLVGSSIKSAVAPIAAFGVQTLLLTTAINGVQALFDSFKADPLVEQFRNAREEAALLRNELKEDPLSRRDRAGKASDDAVSNILNPAKFFEEARKANATRIGKEKDLFGSDFVLERTFEQDRRREITKEFGSDANRKEVLDSLREARALRDEAIRTGTTIPAEFRDAALKRLDNQISFLKDLQASDERLFKRLGGDKSLPSFEKAKKELLELSSVGSRFRDQLRDIKDELEELEIGKLTADVTLSEDIATQLGAGNFDTQELELESARGLNQALGEQVEKQRELLAIEKEKLNDQELLNRLNDPTQQAGALEEQKRIQEDVKGIEKELLGSRKELANQTTDLLKQERERTLNAIELVQAEKDLASTRERRQRIAGSNETPFTFDLDENDNLNKIEEAGQRLLEFQANGSEKEIVDAERALTDAIIQEEERRLEVFKKGKQNQADLAKLFLSVESSEIAKELNARVITQAQADQRISENRQRSLEADIAQTEDRRARLLEDFANAPQTEANEVEFTAQLNSVESTLADQVTSLLQERTNARIAEEDRFLEKARNASESLVNVDKAKTDALIRNIQQVDGESDSLLRSLDRQEKALQSQFDLINAQQGRATQRFDVEINESNDASSVLDILSQEKGVREQISDLRGQSSDLSKEEREDLKLQKQELQEQLLTTAQSVELRRQLRETVGSGSITEKDLLKSRIKLEEQISQQRGQALAAELEQERALLQLSIQRDQLAAKAATRQAQSGLIQSQFQQTEQRQSILGIERELLVAEDRGDPEQVSLLESQLQVAREGLQLTQQQIGLSGGVLRDSQLAEIDVEKFGELALKTLGISQSARAEGFIGQEEAQRRQFNLSTIQSGGEQFIGDSAIEKSIGRFLRSGIDLDSSSRGPRVESSEKAINKLLDSSKQQRQMQDAALKSLDSTVRNIGDNIVSAIERNALKLPKRRQSQKRSSAPEPSATERQLREAGLL